MEYKKLKGWVQDHVETTVLICVLIFLLIPLIWLGICNKYDTFDVLKFTEEWYKTIFSSLGVGVVVILLADRLKNNRIDKKTLRLIEDQKNNSRKIIREFETNSNNRDTKNAINQFLSCHYILNNRKSNYLNEIKNSAIIIDEMDYYIKNIDNNPNWCVNSENYIKEFCHSFLL